MKLYNLLFRILILFIGFSLFSLKAENNSYNGQDSVLQKPVDSDKPAEAESSSRHSAQDPLELYNKKNYEEVAAIYEQRIDDDEKYSGYYYNLGNCYYKQNLFGKAILNYERALRLDPLDQDIRKNLRMAQLKTVDKVANTSTWVDEAWHTVSFSFSLTVINIIAFFFFCVLLTSVVTVFVSRTARIKKTGISTGFAALIITILFNLMAYHQKKYFNEGKNEAIVIEREVAVRSTPDQSGTLLFNLHEGTKVKITGTPISGWYPISVGADKEGWLAENTVERILKNSNKTND